MKQEEQEKYRLSILELTEVENENEAVAYIALKMMFDRARVFEPKEYGSKKLTPKKEIIANFNISNLYYEVSGKYELSNAEKIKLIEGVKGLIDSKVVELIYTDGKENYCLNIASLYMESDRLKYTEMTLKEIRDIFNIPCKQVKQKYALLRFAVCLFNTINYETKCGWCSFRKMPELTATSCLKTCQNYFNLLEKNNIIYVHHSKTYKVNESGDIKTLTNVYGRPCDKKAIDDYADMRNKKEGHNFTNNMTTNGRGKTTKQYNKFIEGSYTGDVLELIQSCLMYNKQPYQEQHPKTQKNMSVFNSELVEQAKETLNDFIKQYKKKNKESKSFPKTKTYTKPEEDYDLDELFN